jgi:CheY-like chemotaxis protein
MPASAELTGLHVLVVEDDPIIALDVKATLESAGATVIGTAYRVAQAVALLDAEFDVAVLDFRLEAETAKPIADKLLRRGVPFLFYTSSRGHPQMAFPGVPIIEKPAYPDALVAAVKRLAQGEKKSA